MKTKLSHLDRGRRPAMVDVSEKPPTKRVARAGVEIALPPAVARLFRGGDLRAAKGPVVQTAMLAGTMAVKRTSELIPLCHPLPVEGCLFTHRLDARGVLHFECEVRTTHKTGVEMEALTGASVAALTVYDMCKALSHRIVIRRLRLLRKSGGRSEFSAR